MKVVYPNGSIDVVVPAGQKIALKSVGAGTAIVLVSNAPVNFPEAFTEIARFSDSEVTLGTYAADKTVRIMAGSDSVEYVVDTDPVLSSAIYETYVRLANDTYWLTGAGAPVDYTDGTPPATGEGLTGIGSLYSDVTNGKLYINGGTKAQPIWKLVTSAA